MTDLHPDARALIDAAKRGEARLSAGARARVHRSVLRRAAAFGAAIASTTTASVAAKGGVLVGVLASPLATAGVVGAIGGVALFVAQSVWMAPAPPIAPAATPHTIVHDDETTGRLTLPAPAPAQAPAAAFAPPVAQASESGQASAFPVAQAPEPVPAPAQALAPAEAPAPALAPAPRPQSVARRPDHAAAPPTELGIVPVSTPRHAVVTELVDAGGGALPESPGELSPIAATAPPEPIAGRRPGDIATALAVLHRAHAALHAGQPEQALELLREGAPVLDSGPFAEEAQAALASALCQSGRTREARAAIDRFLVAWPGSPLAARVRGGCEELGGARSMPRK